MRQAILTRMETCDEGTFGRLDVLDERTGAVVFSCSTLELPWRGNRRGVSCVPASDKGYLFKWRTDSPKHGECYEEWDDPDTAQREDVAGRDNVQIHAANLAGDAEKGYVAQLLGCIAPGLSVVRFRAGHKPAGDKDQRGVSASKSALEQLVAVLRKETFRLVIKWAPNVAPEEAA